MISHRQAESYIKSYEGKFNVVVCQNDNEAFGAMDAMKAAGISYGVDGDVILVSFDACTAGLEYVMSGDINADFECNPLAAPFVEEVIKQLQAGETPEKEVYMTEHWFVNEDVLSTINVRSGSDRCHKRNRRCPVLIKPDGIKCGGDHLVSPILKKG